MSLRQRFESLLIYDPNRSPMTVNVWISRPSVSEEQALGKLIVVAALPGNSRLNLDVINILQDELRTAYYQSTDNKPERAFEHALQQVNRRLHGVITDGVADWVDSAAIFIGAAWRDQFICSSVGAVHAWLLRKNRMHDVLGETDIQPNNPIRLFSQVLSGDVQVHDLLLISTSTILDFFSLEKLRRTMSDGSPSAAIHQWETTLLGVEQQTALGAVLVSCTAEEQIITPVSRPVPQATLSQTAPQVSMEQLIAKEQSTQQLLSPSLWPSVRDASSQVWHGITSGTRRLMGRPPRRSLPTPYQSLARQKSSSPRTYLLTLQILFRRVMNSLRTIVSAFRKTNSAIPTTPDPVTMSPHLRVPRWSLNTSVRWFQALTGQQQLLFGFGILLVFIIAVSAIPRSKNQSTNNAASSTTSISDHIAQAKAALLYGGESVAQEHVNAAQDLIAALPHRTAKEKSAQQEYQQQIQTVITQLAHQTTIASPTIVAQLSTAAPQARPQQLYLVGPKLIAVDPNTATVISAPVNSSTAPTLIEQQQDLGQPTTGTVTGPSTITFATDELGFIDLDTTKNAWKELTATWPTPGPRLQALAAYQSRLYALDANHASIVRFSKGGTTLGAGVSWLKEPANLGPARGIAVDGSVYILQPNNVVEVYANGRRGTFTVPTITPSWGDLTRLWTDATSTKLYLLDSSRQRIVVITKSGALVDQYTSPNWTSIQDFAINEKTKTAYVLNNGVITSFTLLH